MLGIGDILASGTFWTALGSIATAVGVSWVIYKETRTKLGSPGGPDRRKNREGRSERITNRDKILACLTNHANGATLEQIAEETGIPIGSLSSDMAGREAMGIDKEGYGKTAIYRRKN